MYAYMTYKKYMTDIEEREQKIQLEKRVEGPGNDSRWT